MVQYLLSEDDRNKIQAALARLDNQPTSPKFLEMEDLGVTPDIYLGLLPCDSVIPKRVDQALGVYSVCLYKAVGSGTSYKLEPVYLPKINADDDDASRTIVRVDCYNIYTDDIGANEEFIRMQRTKFGRWLAEKPSESAAVRTTSPSINNNTCTGTCTWRWDHSSYVWVEQIDGCDVGTTTTGDPVSVGCEQCPTTVRPAETTTTCDPTDPACLGSCCDNDGTCTDDMSKADCDNESSQPTVWISSQTCVDRTDCTTTTTAAPIACSCLYPDFCGTEDGQTTVTFCTSQTQECSIDCCTTTTSTTTTCDCNTTTSSAPCSDGCDWEWIPNGSGLGGLNGWGWTLISNGCGAHCNCDYPTGLSSLSCDSAHTPCIIPPDPPPVPPCNGNCVFWWIPSQSQWVLSEASCTASTFDNCQCEYPSEDGDECAPVVLPCVTVTTTHSPCGDCYSTNPPTTTSTSTTCSPCSYSCGNFCGYVASTECGKLLLQDDNCPHDDCSCPETSGIGINKDGSYVKLPCVETVPTTTASPCATRGCHWKYSCECDPAEWVLVSDDCTGDCPECYDIVPEDLAGAPAPSCNQSFNKYCSAVTTTPEPTTSTTTTEAPTTTTVCPVTTTQAPDDGACCYNYGSCIVETESECEARDEQSWTADVGCDAVTCATTTTTACRTTTTCDPTDPACLMGSCCYNFGECSYELEEVCDGRGETAEWTEHQPCPPSPACATTTTTTLMAGYRGTRCDYPDTQDFEQYIYFKKDDPETIEPTSGAGVRITDDDSPYLPDLCVHSVIVRDPCWGCSNYHAEAIEGCDSCTPRGCCCSDFGTCDNNITEAACLAKTGGLPAEPRWTANGICNDGSGVGSVTVVCVTTTTTTANPCSGTCTYEWNFGSWMNTVDSCGGGAGCHCEEPSYDGTSEGQIAAGTCVE